MASATKSKEYQLAIKIAGSVSSSFNSAMGDAESKITNLGTVAKQAAAVAAAAWGALRLGEFISDAVGTYQEFEQAMANASAIAGATQEQYDALEQAALAMGKATSKTAAESADALGYMALAGWSVEDSIASLEPILRLSEATGMDLAQCLDLVTDSMSALGIEVQDLAGYLDVAAMANNKSNQTAQMLMEAYIGVGGTMKGLGVPIQESAAALGVLANRGIKGSEAGTALNAVLVNLTTGTGQAGKMMEKLGISAFDSNGKFIGLEETIRMVSNATAGMTEEERNAALAAIGGKQHIDALNALMAGLNTTTADGVTEWEALSNSLYNSQGAMATMADTVTNTWQGASARLESAIDDLKINLVSTFAPYAISAINSIAASIPAITESLTGTIQAFMTTALPKIAAFKDRAIEIFEQIRPALESIGNTALSAFSFLANAAGTAMQGISEAIQNHSGTFEKLGQIAANVGEIISDIGERLKPVITYATGTALPKIADTLLDIIDKLADLALIITENKGLVIALASAFAAFKGYKAVSGLADNFTAASKAIDILSGKYKGMSALQLALDGKLGKSGTIVGVLSGKINLAELATEGWKKALGNVTSGFKNIKSVGTTILTGLKGGITSIGTLLKGTFASIGSFLAANPVVLVIAAIAAVIAIIVTLYNKCEWFREKVDAIIEAVKGYLQVFLEKAKAIFETVWSVIKSVWAKIQPYLQAAWQTITAAASAVVSFFQTNVLPGIKAVWNSICAAFSAAWELIKTVWAAVAPFFRGIWETIKSIFAVVAPVIGGFFRAAWAVVQAIWQVASGWFAVIWANIKAVFSVVAAVLGGFFRTAWEAIKAVWNTVVAYFQAIFDTIAGIFSFVQAVLSGDFAGAWEAIKGIVNTWGAFFQTVWEGIKAVFGSVVSWFTGIFSAAWEGIKSVFSQVGAFFQGVWNTIVSLFTSIGTAVGDAISGAVKGAINAVIGGAVRIINGFISAINFAIDVINAIPGVNIARLNTLEIPQMAKGGIVTGPTILEAGEAGTEAIIPLPELWSQMRGMVSDMIASSMSGVTTGIAALAERLDAADVGSTVLPISEILGSLTRGPDPQPQPADGPPPYQITYAPQYHFEGAAPSKEDLAEAERMSQEEFDRHMARWTKDNDRKKF